MIEHFLAHFPMPWVAHYTWKPKGKRSPQSRKFVKVFGRTLRQAMLKGIRYLARKGFCNERCHPDTGCACLRSLCGETPSYNPVVSRDTNTILQADKVFCRGWYASAAMEKLTERELVPLIKAPTQPVLASFSMQLLGSFSEEGQSTVPLLGLIDSPVQKMDAMLPVPHSGWNWVKALAGNPV